MFLTCKLNILSNSAAKCYGIIQNIFFKEKLVIALLLFMFTIFWAKNFAGRHFCCCSIVGFQPPLRTSLLSFFNKSVSKSVIFMHFSRLSCNSQFLKGVHMSFVKEKLCSTSPLDGGTILINVKVLIISEWRTVFFPFKPARQVFSELYSTFN